MSLVNYVQKKRTCIFSTKGNDTLRQNVRDVFGFRFLQRLKQVDFSMVLTEVEASNSQKENTYPSQDPSTGQSTVADKCTVTGLISDVTKANKASPVHSAGSAETQLFFINGRPVVHRKLRQTLLSVWEMADVKTKPSFFLSFHLPGAWVDANVTPDKRTILMKHEESLLYAFAEQLMPILKKEEETFVCSLSQQTLGFKKPAMNQLEAIDNEEKRQHEASAPSVAPQPVSSITSSPPAGAVKRAVAKKSLQSTSVPNKRPLQRLAFGGMSSIRKAFQARLDEEYQVTKKARFCTDFEKISYKNQDADLASRELETTFSRDDFRTFSLVGQFNLGFLITRVGENLFLFDQHACDEIRRFETLINATKIQSQALIKPWKLDVTTIESRIIEEHANLLTRFGFKLEEKNGTYFLLAVPQALHSDITIKDFKQLLARLLEQSSVVYCSQIENSTEARQFNLSLLPKLRSRFASRACRGAIMIGTALKETKQREIVQNLYALKKPFNCPHGRPTMRHLVNMKQFYASRNGCDSPATEPDVLDSDACLYFSPVI